MEKLDLLPVDLRGKYIQDNKPKRKRLKCKICGSSDLEYAYNFINEIDYIDRIKIESGDKQYIKVIYCKPCGSIAATINSCTLSEILGLIDCDTKFIARRHRKYAVKKSISSFWKYNSRILSNMPAEMAKSKVLSIIMK